MKKQIITAVVMIVSMLPGCGDSLTEPGIEENEQGSIHWEALSGKLAYSRSDENGKYLFIADGDEKKVTLVNASGDYSFANLCWKSDGSVITFSDFDGTFWQLYNIKPDGSGVEPVYSAHAHCNYAAWSRDGRLAYWYNAGMMSHPDEIRIDGGTFFNKKFCNQSRPAWSPDGTYLVISARDSASQGSLYGVSLADTSAKPLMSAKGGWNDEIYSEPVFSPDGRKIAFVKSGRSINFQSEIWTIDTDGANPRRLTFGYIDYNPAWSPDGTSIAFVRIDFNISNVFAVNVKSGTVVQVTTRGADYVSWIP